MSLLMIVELLVVLLALWVGALRLSGTWCHLRYRLGCTGLLF